MTLFNAFEGLLTERTGRMIMAAASYAKDINDRMRVVVDSGSIGVTDGPFMNSATSVTYRSPYDVRAVFTVDQREEMRLMSKQAAFNQRQRWTR